MAAVEASELQDLHNQVIIFSAHLVLSQHVLFVGVAPQMGKLLRVGQGMVHLALNVENVA